MMQEYDDDFFFEEDKISRSELAMWRSELQNSYFNDPRIYPLHAPVHNMFEDRFTPPVKKPENNFVLQNEETAITFDEATKSVEDTRRDSEEDKLIKGEENTDTECIFNDLRQERYMIYHQDLMGMTVTSGSVVLSKDDKNLIGISIGGGAPLCPCLYIVQMLCPTLDQAYATYLQRQINRTEQRL